MNQPDIELTIDELVLNGFPPMNRYRVQEALETELAALFRDRERSAEGFAARTEERVDAGTIRVTPESTPEMIGKQIATSIFGGIQK